MNAAIERLKSSLQAAKSHQAEAKQRATTFVRETWDALTDAQGFETKIAEYEAAIAALETREGQ